MNIRGIFNFFRKKKETKQFKGVADFFLHASDKEMKEVMIKAAKKSNELQIDVMKRAEQL